MAINLASHWVQVNGATGDVMNQRVMDGPNTILDTTVDVGGTDAALTSDFTNEF